MRGVFFALALSAASCAPPPTPSSAAYSRLEKPAGFALVDSQGKDVKVPSAGTRAVIVDFWASDCGPCKRSIPKLLSRARELEPHGVSLVLVGVVRDDEATDHARDTLRSWGVLREFLVDRGGVLQKALDIRALPATLVLDAGGTVHWFAPPGASDEDIAAAARSVAAR